MNKISVFTVMIPDLTPEEAAPALAAAGYEGWLSMEDFSSTRPSRETLRHNLAFIKNLI